jgi:hypothetical protein
LPPAITSAAPTRFLVVEQGQIIERGTTANCALQGATSILRQAARSAKQFVLAAGEMRPSRRRSVPKR